MAWVKQKNKALLNQLYLSLGVQISTVFSRNDSTQASVAGKQYDGN